MKSSFKKVLQTMLLCALTAGASAQTFPSLGNIGPSKGEVVGIAVGAAAAIGVVVYLAIPKHKLIEGCVEESHDVKLIRGQQERVYEISGDGPTLMPGRRMKVKAKKLKGKSKASIRVLKVLADEGTCIAP